MKEEYINSLIDISIEISKLLKDSKNNYEIYNLESLTYSNPIRVEADKLIELNIDIQKLIKYLYNVETNKETLNYILNTIKERLEEIKSINNKIR